MTQEPKGRDTIGGREVYWKATWPPRDQVPLPGTKWRWNQGVVEVNSGIPRLSSSGGSRNDWKIDVIREDGSMGLARIGDLQPLATLTRGVEVLNFTLCGGDYVSFMFKENGVVYHKKTITEHGHYKVMKVEE